MIHFEIIPAVLPNTREELQKSFEKIANLSHKIHLDAADGILVSHKSFPYTEKDRHLLLPEGGSAECSVHLMVSHPFEIAEKYINAGAKEIYVHVESFESDTLLLKFMHAFARKVSVGLSIAPKTPIEKITHAISISHVERVMVMTLTDIGRQGSEFDKTQLRKIKELRNMFPNIHILADGSVNATNIRDVKFSGANGCVVGSALMKSEKPAEEYARLQGLVLQ
jgi:pentose-5-phosphate-3-epimerase